MNRLYLYLICFLNLLLPTNALCWMNVVQVGGGVAAEEADRTPSGFGSVYQADTGVAVSTLSTAGETYTVAGVDADTDISISGTGTTPQYQIDAGSWTSTAGTVSNGDVVGVRQTSSASNSTETTAIVTIGTVSDTYSVTTVAGGTTYYAGFPTTGGTPNAPVGGWSDYGSNADRIYCEYATGITGTANAINVYAVKTFTTMGSAYVLLYNGTTLVGRGDVSSATAGSWTGYTTLTVESGESLAFTSGDTMYFCLGVDDPGTDQYGAQDNNGGNAVKFDTQTWSGGDPPATASWGTSGTAFDYGAILRYTN